MENFTLTENEGSTFKQLEAGSYPAKLIGLIDLGTQRNEFEGQIKEPKKIRLVFEVNEERETGVNFTIKKDFTWSFHEKAGLRKFLQTWRGKSFTAEELKGFDLTKLLGVNALLAIGTKESKNGKTYSTLDSASLMPKGMTPFIGSLEPFIFLISSGANWERLDKWTQETILQSPEGLAKGYKIIEQESKAVATTDDDLPF
jgi:hypothetical protein